ncbi:MAG: DUF1127 domain-containing protein [Pseudomonadota bacterium]
MAYSSSNQVRIGFGRRISEIFTLAREQWAFYRIYRQTYNELSALPTRDLDDLGIGRAEIKRLALEAAAGDTRPHQPR